MTLHWAPNAATNRDEPAGAECKVWNRYLEKVSHFFEAPIVFFQCVKAEKECDAIPPYFGAFRAADGFRGAEARGRSVFEASAHDVYLTELPTEKKYVRLWTFSNGLGPSLAELCRPVLEPGHGVANVGPPFT
jgi:hypothetical protein